MRPIVPLTGPSIPGALGIESTVAACVQEASMRQLTTDASGTGKVHNALVLVYEAINSTC